MRDPDRRVGHVDVLAAGTARAVGINPQVLLVDLNLDVLGQLGPDENRGERGVTARRLVERRDPHKPVDARLRQQQPVGVVTRDGQGRGLDPRLVAGLPFDDLNLEVASLGPAQIRADEHLGPIL